MEWEGPDYLDHLSTLMRNDIFPPAVSGLTSPAEYDLWLLIDHACNRIQAKWSHVIHQKTVEAIRDNHSQRYIVKYPKEWAKDSRNLRFLQWQICQACRRLEMGPHNTAEIVDFVTIELVGKEFEAPKACF